MPRQHNTGTHPFYIGMYIHIFTHIFSYAHIYLYILLRRNVYVFFRPHPIAARSLLHHHLSSVRNVVRDLQAAPLINGWCSFSLGFLLEGPLPFLQSRGRAQQRKQTVHESWKSKRPKKNVPHLYPGNCRPYPDFLGFFGGPEVSHQVEKRVGSTLNSLVKLITPLERMPNYNISPT